ncbi:phosphoethanolamine transferase [Tepidicaulis sp.]|uniref:phosphoethanolamine transferase n=1 Tax=Tepidicaulis sp. TaxID=1920809 RepID=UPI003B5C45FF
MTYKTTISSALRRRSAGGAGGQEQGVHPLLLAFGASAALLLFYNVRLWQTIWQAWPGRSLEDYAFLGSLGLVLCALFFLLLQLAALPRIMKPVLAVLFLLAAATSWFTSSYGVMFDQTMIANIVETDTGEAGDLLSVPFLLHMLLLGVLPAALIFRVPLRWPGWRRELFLRAGSLVTCLVIIGLSGAFFFQDYASLIRNNRYLRHMINPTSPIYYSAKYLTEGERGGAGGGEIRRLAKTVRRGKEMGGPGKPLLFVVVVGETARAADFSLNGYERETNPELAALGVVSFKNAYSCGTSTAESLPCMFSAAGREVYDRADAMRSENALDILKRADVDVLWVENNSGCKGVCARIETEQPDTKTYPDLCTQAGCPDEVLVEALKRRVRTLKRDMVIVLHQMGSHGPAYYKRYPARFGIFAPVCGTVNLQSCSSDEIRNTYDNSIRYTDHVLAGVIGVLQQHRADADTALLYASDHGESLGEMGLYLHGLPYAFSPDVQRHIPFLLWISDGYAARFGIERAALSRRARLPATHDAIFHTILGALNVETELYDRALDLFSAGAAEEKAAPQPGGHGA